MSTTTPYIDLPTFLAPTFTPQSHANALLLSTNNPTDTPLDLSTPLSRALFDLQEVDTHIDTLTTSHALPVIQHTRVRAEAGTRVLENVEERVRALGESYARLEREVGERHESAEEVRVAAGRVLATLRLGRGVQRAVGLGRQLEGFVEEGAGKGGWRAMVPAARAVVGLREVFAGEEGEALGRVRVVGVLKQEVVGPKERVVLGRAQGVVREFSMSSLLASASPASSGAASAAAAAGQHQQQQQQQTAQATTQTFAQTEDTKARTTAALQTLYLLSPTKPSTTLSTFDPTLLISALQSYLQTALTSSLAALTRALATLPTLDRTLLEISARCQNIVALEALLQTTKPPPHPYFPETESESAPATVPNFLAPLLRHLDTSSLPSYFWRSMAGQLTSRVHDILSRGGVSARTLRTNKERVRDAIRECVDRGSRLPVSSLSAGRKGDEGVKSWEREAAVMAQAVVGPLR